MQTYPGTSIEKVTTFPFTKKCRKIFVPSGDVTIVVNGVSITILDAELGAINNQALFIDEITSASGGVVFVTT